MKEQKIIGKSINQQAEEYVQYGNKLHSADFFAALGTLSQKPSSASNPRESSKPPQPARTLTLSETIRKLSQPQNVPCVASHIVGWETLSCVCCDVRDSAGFFGIGYIQLTRRIRTSAPCPLDKDGFWLGQILTLASFLAASGLQSLFSFHMSFIVAQGNPALHQPPAGLLRDGPTFAPHRPRLEVAEP